MEDDDDGGPGLDSELNFTFTTAGTYYLGISSSSNEQYDAETGLGDQTGGASSTGGYFLTFEDTNDEIDEAILNNLNNGFGSGLVDLNTDVDLFRFDAVGGQSFRFEVDGDRVGSTGLDSIPSQNALLQANRLEALDRAFDTGSFDERRNDFDSPALAQRESIRTLANDDAQEGGIHAQATDDFFAILAEEIGAENTGLRALLSGRG